MEHKAEDAQGVLECLTRYFSRRRDPRMLKVANVMLNGSWNVSQGIFLMEISITLIYDVYSVVTVF